jgi:hypothetical protein
VSDNAIQSPGYTHYSIDSLLLDAENPRLVEYGLTAKATQFDILKILWERMAVEEVAMSIAHNGYFEHEPLFATERRGLANFVVIEGNRRLAAVKLLLDGTLRRRLRATNLPEIDRIAPARRAELTQLPVVITTKRDIWRYLGFKHVNGPATWSSYSKAQYIAQVHNEYGVSLADIAAQIGDYNSTVERMYRGLMVILQAEAGGGFSRADTFNGKFYFSYIYSGIELPRIRSYVGITDTPRAERHPVPRNKLTELTELCLWLYGSKSQNTRPIISSQNPDLHTLDAVLGEDRGAAALRDGLSLSIAHDISQGDERLFKTSLHSAKHALQTALSRVTSGYDTGDADAFDLAVDVEALAQDLVEIMSDRRKKSQLRRSHESKASK